MEERTAMKTSFGNQARLVYTEEVRKQELKEKKVQVAKQNLSISSLLVKKKK